MKKYKIRHQNLLLHCLKKRLICPASFLVLTNLTDKDAKRGLSTTLGETRKVVANLGLMVEYHIHRRNKDGWALFKIRDVIGQNLFLWCSVIEIQHIPKGLDNNQLGLMLLAKYDYRLAVLWSIRLKVNFLPHTMTVINKDRLFNTVNQILNHSLVSSNQVD
ncbi:hypothetical protein [Photobacterium leiognathi]|uniref:hypothetical protein n=1 Tax=Photobacterium leiognathi TaxID=553611 RepID=UPI002980E624|nr:hypothetical protein [Photobacterium leiognathi]